MEESEENPKNKKEEKNEEEPGDKIDTKPSNFSDVSFPASTPESAGQTPEVVSLGGVDSAQRLHEVITEKHLSSLHVDISSNKSEEEVDISSDRSEENEDEELVCPIMAQTVHECASGFIKPPPLPVQETSSSGSGLEAARQIMRQILKRVDKATSPVKLKTPTMKSGWMSLAHVIPDFEIDDATFEKLLFRENLLVSKFEEEHEYPVPVGGLSLDVQSAKGGPLNLNKRKTRSDYLCPKFLVHLSSQFDFCGHNGGSKIISWVDRDLQTLEESRKEFVELSNEGDFDQESIYVNSQQDFYYLRHNKKEDKFYSAQRARNLICEGSSFVLMRYLALKRFIGTFEVSTLYINGDLCRNIYGCKGPESGMVHNQKMDVCKIYRTIIEECGIVHKSLTLMTLAGRILKHEWHDHNTYILQVNPLIEIGSKPSPYEHVPLEKAFETDLQLLSLFLDAKTANRKRIECYMNDYPEIKHHISDYVQTILQLKPEDVFEFSAKYFLGFTPHLLPYTEYFEPPEAEDDEEDVQWWKYF